jgi:predicted RNase H-like HicB family nuclease
MPIVFYPAIIERGARPRSYGVFFPDLPGCTSAGDTPQDAARNAENALRGHLALMIEDGDRLPPPSDVAALPRDSDVHEVARVLVRADLPGKAVRLNISMDEGMVAQMDAAAARRGLPRSTFLAELVRAEIKRGAKSNRTRPARRARGGPASRKSATR